jgi:hypothetical protein
MSFCMRVTRSASGTSDAAIKIRMSWRRSGCVNPGSTVRIDLDNIYDKIGVSTRAAAALWAMQHAVVG